MSFARQRVPGAWLLGSVIDPAELEYFDDAISRAIDGQGGGAYALQSDLLIGGASGVSFEVEIPAIFDMVTIGESLTVIEDISCAGQVTTQRLDVNFVATFDGDTVHNGEVVFNDDVTLDNDVFLTGPSYVYGGIGFYSGAFFENGSDPEFNAPAVFNDPVEVNAPVTLGSGGHIKKRVLVVTTSTPPGGVSPKDYDEIQLSAGSYPAGGIAIIKDDVTDGAAVTVVTRAPIQVTLYGGDNVLGLLHATAGSTGINTHMRRIEARRVNGAWIAFDSQPA